MSDLANIAVSIDMYASRCVGEGYSVLGFSAGPGQGWRFIKPDMFTLVYIEPPVDDGIGAVEIVGAGARGLSQHRAVFRYIATHAVLNTYGSMFGSVRADELVLTGIRLRVPLSIIDVNNKDVMGFLYSMVPLLGSIGHQDAKKLIERHGGRLLDGANDDDAVELYRASNGRA